MRPQTRHFYDRGVFQAVEQISQSSGELIFISDIAASVGVSEDHFAELFRKRVGESLGHFIYRMRLERSAQRLMKGVSVADVAEEAGYGSAEAFARTFKKKFGFTPRSFSSSGVSPYLRAGCGVHWSDGEMYVPLSEGDVGLRVRRLETVTATCYRYVGDYGRIENGWNALARILGERVHGPWIAIYHDDGKRVNDRDSMRADLGFVGRESIDGMQCVEMPAGYYVQAAGWVDPSDHVAAWDVINANWVAKSGARPVNIPAYELYESWPLPWLSSRVQISLGLEMDLGDAH